MPVILRPVRGFPGYRVGSDGSVWSAWRLRGRSDGGRGVESYISSAWKKFRGVRRKDGYTKITLRKEGRGYDFLLHRLVLETFVGPCPEGMECCHRNGDKSNCRADNLYWGTRLDNIQDAIRHGTFYNATRAAAEVNRGKERPQEVRDKISAGNSGVPKSLEHREALVANHWSRRPGAADVIARREETKRRRGNSGRHR